MDFSCPACGKSHKVPSDRIPASGARGNCAGCGAGLFVAPDGRAKLLDDPPQLSLQHPPARETAAVEPPPPRLVETAPTATWEIQVGGEVLGPFPFGDLKHLVLTDRLPADGVVRPSGGDWGPASTFAILAPLFAPKTDKGGDPGEGYYGGEDRCFQHSDAAPTHLCSQCHRYMCAACVKELPIHEGRRTIPQCPACGGPATVLKRRTVWTPFYLDVGKALKAPFESGHAVLYFGLLAFMQACKIPCAAVPIVGLMAIIVLTVFQTTFYLHVVRAVGNGSYDMPEWPDVGNYLDMVFGFLKVLFVTLVALLPVIVLGCVGGAGLAAAAGMMGGRGGDGAAAALMGPWIILVILLILFYILYLPVCIAIVAVFDTVAPALNPVVIFKIIFRFGPTYLLAALLWTALIVINASTTSIMGRAGIGGAILHAPVEVYTTLVMAYILGRIVYENEERVGWY